jgi:hypothetical protein
MDTLATCAWALPIISAGPLRSRRRQNTRSWIAAGSSLSNPACRRHRFTTRADVSTSLLRLRWSPWCERRLFGRRRRHSTRSQPRCPHRSFHSRFERGRWTSPTTSRCSVAPHTRLAPTPSCTARSSPSAPTLAAGRSTSMTRLQWWIKRPACWLIEPRRSCTDLGRHSGHRGRRTIGSRSPRRSWLARARGVPDRRSHPARHGIHGAEDEVDYGKRGNGRGEGASGFEQPPQIRAVLDSRTHEQAGIPPASEGVGDASTSTAACRTSST